MNTKRDIALSLAEELLSDIELGQIKPIDIARKASRLARLTDDVQATAWLNYEISGYPEGPDDLNMNEWSAALRSNRVYKVAEEGKTKEYARIHGLGELTASIASAEMQLAVSASGTYLERGNLRNEMVQNQKILDKIIGSVHLFTSTKYQELRFGAAVSSAFDALRDKVDSQINRLIPDALPILTTALENANSDNPLHWKSAAQACRDLIKFTADTVRPPGPPKNGREMTNNHYVNRLMDWMDSQSGSRTMKDLAKTDVEFLGRRLDAVTVSGHKGAHASVEKEDVLRYIIGTYVFLGDVLSLHNPEIEAVREQNQELVLKDLPKKVAKKPTPKKTKGVDEVKNIQVEKKNA
jgi:hypothetical protein